MTSNLFDGATLCEQLDNIALPFRQGLGKLLHASLPHDPIVSPEPGGDVALIAQHVLDRRQQLPCRRVLENESYLSQFQGGRRKIRVVLHGQENKFDVWSLFSDSPSSIQAI